MFCRRFLFLFFAFALSCCKETPPQAIHHSDNLKLIGRFPIPVAEPSGVALAVDGKSLWVVSDEEGKVHQLDLEGREIRRFGTGLKDVEDIAVIDAHTLALIAERERRVTRFDLSGRIVGSGAVDIPGDDNMGPESLAFDPVSQIYYVLKEMSPGTLLTLDAALNETSRSVLAFARDYSSLSYEPTRGHLWVMSDLSQALYVLDGNLKIQAVFSTGVTQQEGLAVDYKARRVYIVSDATEELYVFGFDDY